MERYSDLPLGGTDASVIALAERLDVATVVTLDRRHFAAVAPRGALACTFAPPMSSTWNSLEPWAGTSLSAAPPADSVNGA